MSDSSKNEKTIITFDLVVRWVVGIIIVGIIVWLADILKNVLLPFVVACLIAYMLEPIVEFIQEKFKLKHRIIPVLLTLVSVILIVGLLVYFFMPLISGEIEQLDKLVKTSDKHPFNLKFLPPEVASYFEKYFNLETLQQYLSDNRFLSVLNQGTSVISATIDFLLHTLEWLIAIVYVIFIMLDYNHLMRGFRLAVPPKYRKRAYPVLDDIKNNMSIYFRSQAVIALCAAIFYCIGFSIVGLPLALVMGLMVGILYMIPYFQYVTLIPVAILCYLSSLTGDASFLSMLGKCILVYVISQSICDYILTPKIMGKTLGLNPAIILLSLSIWGSLLGIIGMIIALPVTSLMISYYKRYILKMPSDKS